MRFRRSQLLFVSAALVACHDSSSDSPPFLALGVNDLDAADRLLAHEDGIVAAAVTETNADLNGDGDQVDSLLEILDLRSGKRAFVANAALGSGVRTGAGFVSFLLSEPDAGVDLNGDGDLLDPVAHVYDARRGSLRNLGRATFVAPAQAGALIAFGAYEESGRDLNGDGDFEDVVAHVYEADRGRLSPLTVAANGETIRIRGRRVLYLDDPDPSVQVYDADTHQLRSLPHSIDAMWVEGALLATLVPEWENGNLDLNRNGRTGDGFVELHDLDTGHVRATAENDCWILALGEDLAVVALEEPLEPVEVRVYDLLTDTLSDPIGNWDSSVWDIALTSARRHAYLVDEGRAGADLDGDGQQLDLVLHVFDARTGTVRNIGWASFSAPQIDARRVAFLGLARPSDERPPSHTSVHVLDLATGLVSALDLMASDFRLVDGRIVALTPEEWQGVDLDGDQALTHTVLQVHDLATGETLGTGLTVGNFDDEFNPIVLDGDVLALVAGGRLWGVRLR